MTFDRQEIMGIYNEIQKAWERTKDLMISFEDTEEYWSKVARIMTDASTPLEKSLNLALWNEMARLIVVHRDE